MENWLRVQLQLTRRVALNLRGGGSFGAVAGVYTARVGQPADSCQLLCHTSSPPTSLRSPTRASSHTARCRHDPRSALRRQPHRNGCSHMCTPSALAAILQALVTVTIIQQEVATALQTVAVLAPITATAAAFNGSGSITATLGGRNGSDSNRGRRVNYAIMAAAAAATPEAAAAMAALMAVVATSMAAAIVAVCWRLFVRCMQKTVAVPCSWVSTPRRCELRRHAPLSLTPHTRSSRLCCCMCSTQALLPLASRTILVWGVGTRCAM